MVPPPNGAGYDVATATEALLKRMRRTDNNYEFLETLTKDLL
jgi:transcription termination factor Rho